MHRACCPHNVSSLVGPQCNLWIYNLTAYTAGMFMQNPRERECVVEMLDTCQKRCGWPTPSLRSELGQIWENPDALWDGQHR